MSTNTAFAIDISGTAVKLLGLARKKKGEYEVVHVSRHAYDSKGKLPEAVKSAAAALGDAPPMITTSVWASTMILRKISLPKIKPQEVRSALELEADKYIPFGMDECVMDYYSFPADPQSPKMDVMLVASKKDLIHERCRLFEDAGLKLAYMDIHPVAFANWALARKPDLASGCKVLIRIGDCPGRAQGEDNFIVILNQGVPWVIRDLGDRFAAPEAVPGEAAAQTSALAANALVFFETLAHQRPTEIHVSAFDEVASKLAEAVEKACRIKPAFFSVGEGLSFGDEAVRKSFEAGPVGFGVCLGVAARRLES